MKIYRRYEALSPIYQGGLTNHLPMVLTVLQKLGINEKKIIQKLDQYKDEKTLFDLSVNTTPISEFEQEYVNLTSKYLGEINHKGIDIVVGECINQYKHTIESALYHGLIRLAYAKQEGNPLMIAQAIAYFELVNEEIESSPNYCNKEDVIPLTEKLFEQFKLLHFTFESRATMERFKELLELDIVKKNIVQMRQPKREVILDFILRNYERSGCFYNLHLITGFEALLELEEYIYDFDAVLNHFFVTAQVFVLFNTSDIVVPVTENVALDALAKRVCELTDFHDIKLLFSCIKLNKIFDHELIKPIANRIFIE